MGQRLSRQELNNLPRSREQAIAQGSPYFFSGKTCRNGHVAQRYAGNKGQCFECVSAHARRYRAANPKKQQAFNEKRRSDAWRAEENIKRRARYAQDRNYRFYIRSQGTKHRYGVSDADYQKILGKNRGGCSICGSDETGNPRTNRFDIDHDHVTGKVRGLLCSPCNQMVGHSLDTPEILEKAAYYLRWAGDYRDDEYTKRKMRRRGLSWPSDV